MMNECRGPLSGGRPGTSKGRRASFTSEHYYGRGIFQQSDHERLAARLKGLRSRFILTINDVPEVRALYRWAVIEPARLNYTLSGPATAGRELIIRPRTKAS